jgi:hypothetical protein
VLDIAEELDSIRRVLSERGIEFAVCGGLAMAIYGFVRATVNLDLFVKPEDSGDIEDAAASLGYAIESHRATKIDAAAGDAMMLDLVFVSEDNRHVWNSRQIVMWRDKPLPVVSRDGLITLKRLRGGPYDLADIDRLPTEEMDISNKAIELRMKRLAQIRNLCFSLGKAGAEARRKGQLPPLKSSTSKAGSDPRSGGTRQGSD